MTLIVSIQTKHSAIIASDQRHMSVNLDDMSQEPVSSPNLDHCKMYPLRNGILAGCGEKEIIKRMYQYMHDDYDLALLAKKLDEIKQHRVKEIGQYDQSIHSKIIFSEQKNDQYLQIYLLGNEAEIEKIAPYNLGACVTFYNQELIVKSLPLLQILNTKMKEPQDFHCLQDWFNHYLYYLSQIYTQQSQLSEKSSTNFHASFQMKNHQQILHVLNNSFYE